MPFHPRDSESGSRLLPRRHAVCSTNMTLRYCTYNTVGQRETERRPAGSSMDGLLPVSVYGFVIDGCKLNELLFRNEINTGATGQRIRVIKRRAGENRPALNHLPACFRDFRRVSAVFWRTKREAISRPTPKNWNK